MAARKGTDVNAVQNDEEVLFDTFPPGIRFLEGKPVQGKFLRLTYGPDSEYGKALIAIIEGISGEYADRNGEILEVESGKEYAVWLIAEVLSNGLKELKPSKGERVAFRYDGRKASQTRVDKNGVPQEYNVYQVSCPDRPREDAEVSWDEV